MQNKYYSITHKGKRAVNEDFVFPEARSSASDLFIVCDGLGGHGNGDMASQFATQKLVEYLRPNAQPNVGFLETALSRVNTELQTFGKTNGNPEMGSTAVVLKLNGTTGLVGWVGDSRLYHFRNNEVLFRTEDHTIVELYKKRGFLTGHDFFPNKNIIWQALGTSREEIKPGIQHLANIQSGDRFLLASDGLAEACPDEELFLLLEKPTNEVAKTLQDSCLKNSNDNFSFTLVDIN